MQNNIIQKNVVGLNHLRTFAILFVFIYHYSIFFDHPEFIEPLAYFGWTGVDLFFVLSGYLISNQLFKIYNVHHNLFINQFYLKRILRIFPVFLFVLAIYFFFPLFREKQQLSPLWKYLSFTQNYQLNILKNGGFSHAWSLCVEEQFYLLFPLFLWLIIRVKILNKVWLIGIVAVLLGVLIRHFWWVRINDIFGATKSFGIFWAMKIYFPTYCRLDGLLVGIIIAYLYNFKAKFVHYFLNKGNWLLFFGLCLLTVAYFICENQTAYFASIFGFPLVSIGYGCIVLAALQPNTILLNTSSSITSKLASYSYSMYLIHKITINACQKYLLPSYFDTGSVQMLFCSLFITIFFSFLLYHIIEKPFLKIKNTLVIKK